MRNYFRYCSWNFSNYVHKFRKSPQNKRLLKKLNKINKEYQPAPGFINKVVSEANSLKHICFILDNHLTFDENLKNDIK